MTFFIKKQNIHNKSKCNIVTAIRQTCNDGGSNTEADKINLQANVCAS